MTPCDKAREQAGGLRTGSVGPTGIEHQDQVA
jgi:hypothetical protein